jgi:D,D-heptose 1,7-bisphosphate phosphatase
MGHRPATIRQCVVLRPDLRPCGDRPKLAWVMREFIRYGVTDFLVQAAPGLTDRAMAEIQARLPRPVRIVPITGSACGGEALRRRAGNLPQGHFLLCESGSVPDGDLGTLLAAWAADRTGATGWCLDDGPVCVLAGSAPDWLAEVLDSGVGPVAGGDGMVRVRSAVTRGAGAHPRRRALFLDRDGVLNIDHGYVGSRERFEWVDGALDAIRHATQAGWHVFIVTNQSGVARGLFTEAAVNDLLDWIADEARAAGGTIDDVRFCPFHPDAVVEAYRQAHPWRKPLPGMLLDLIARWELDPAQAVMIGDQETDMRAAEAAGVAGRLFPGGNLLSFLRPILSAQG